jgi:hypothetical protein
MAGTWFTLVKSSSSQTTTRREFWRVKAVLPNIFGTSFFSHVSPVAIEQSCMSLQMFGVMNAKLGAFPAPRSVASCVYGTIWLRQRVTSFWTSAK